MTKTRLFKLIFGLLLTMLLLAAPAGAQENEATDDDVNDVAKGLYCPVCESTPLDVCPTQACADWRDLIRQQLNSGMSEQQIFDYFAQQYGDAVLASPPRSGFSLLLWLFPLLALLVGGGIFARALNNMRSTTVQTVPSTAVSLPASNGTPKKPKKKRQTAVSTSQADLDSYIKQVESELETE